MINSTCKGCPHVRVEADPDPHDWFNDDDVKFICSKALKTIEVGCRPYEKPPIPKWCPL